MSGGRSSSRSSSRSFLSREPKYKVHSYNRNEMCCTFMDDHYPVRSAFSLLNTVVSLTLEAAAWSCMLMMIVMETKIYIHEFRWYIRFVGIYVLIGVATAFNCFFALREYYDKLTLYIFTNGIIYQILFGILLVFYVPSLDPYPGYTPLRADAPVDNTNYELLLGGEQICPERHANFFSRIFFPWITQLMELGCKRPITKKAVWKLDSWDETKTLRLCLARLQRLEKQWGEAVVE